MFIGAPGSSNAAFPPVDGDTIEIAQANTLGGEPIGQITAFQGTAFITHPDGTKVQAADGTSIFQGDVVETETGGAIGITFADESTFSLAENGSMVIDEMVYDPGAQAGKSAISVAEGVFTFVSGKIAKTDVEAMTITTPVAVIGIRGTAGGGKAGPEGTPNTFTMFQDPGGGTGEMVVKTLGGTQVMNTPFQTTQIASKFVPPTIPVILPAAAVARFYSKAAAVAPKAILTGQPDAGPTDQGPTADAPGAAQADKAAEEAFDKVLAEGGDLEAAMTAAQDAATEAGLNAVLLENPDHFGGAGDEIMTRIVDNVLLDVTGNIDFMGAGTGGGLGFDDFTSTMFFENAIDGVINDVIGDFVDDIFGNFFDGDLFGGDGDDFFDLFIDDPFLDFTNDFFFSDDFFFVDDFFFDDDPEFFFEDEFFFEGFVDDDFFFLDPVVFGDEKDATSGDDILIGGSGNTEFVYAQDEAAFGGNDVITDLGGSRDRITFEALDDVAIKLSNNASDSTNFVLIEIDTLAVSEPPTSGNFTAATFTNDFDVANTINLSRQVEDLQALDGGFTNFDSDGVLLFGALNITGSEAGYIVAGTSAGETIDLSGFNTSDTIGSIIFGKGGNDTLTGTSSEDDIIGGAGDDILDGDGGINVIDGGSGNDTINVTVTTSTNDIDGDIGTDTLSYSGLLNTTISTFNFGTFGSLAVSREVSSTVVGGDVVFGIEILNSGQGDDIFNFNTISLGFININGGLGNDSFIFNTAGAQIAATIDGNAGTNTITLNAATFLAGSGGVRNITSITGSSGNDTIKFIGGQTGVTVDLNGGSDTVLLAPATNSLIISNTETIAGSSGNDTITLGVAQSSGTIDLDGGTDVLNLAAGTNSLSLTGIETITGSSGNDTLTITNAQSSGTTVDLGLGNTDTLNLAGGGNTLTVKNLEILNGGAGNDVITSGTTLSITGTTYDLGGGIDTLNLGIGSNTLIISNTETITGNSSVDTITLGAAITGATVDLAGGTDILNLAVGTNSITVTAVETITGASGADTITYAAAITGTVDLKGGNDTIQANGSFSLNLTTTDVENIFGNTAADTFTTAGTSNVILDMGGSGDTATLGSTGVHTIIYSAVSDFGDIINSFSAASDIIDFNVANNGTGFAEIFVTSPIQIGATIGVVNITTDIATPNVATSVAAGLATNFTGQANHQALLVVGDTTNTTAWYWNDTGDGVVDPIELTAVADFVGLNNDTLTVANFSGFA